MKQYDPYRGPGCPSGKHEEHDPRDDSGRPLGPDEAARLGVFNEVCDCPWLVVTSTTPVHHMTSWTRREVERLIKEADDGYFDPRHLPPRNGRSQFMPPLQQRLLLLLEQGKTLAAVQYLIGNLAFDRVAWDPATACLSLRHETWKADGGVQYEWLQLWLNGTDGDDLTSQFSAMADAPGGNPETIDGIWEERDRADVLAEDANRQAIAGARPQVRELVSATLARGGVTDEALERAEESQGWVDIPLPFPPAVEPVAVGQVFKHRLRARWIEVTYVSDDGATAVGRPVDSFGAGIRGRRSTITIEPGGNGLKMYDRDREAETS